MPGIRTAKLLGLACVALLALASSVMPQLHTGGAFKYG